MAMGSERSKPLHNFTMPCLKWGNQRFLRCMKVNPNGGGGGGGGDDRRSSATELEKGLIRRTRELDPERRGSVDRIERSESFVKSPSPGVGGSGRKSKVESDRDDGIEAVRAKLMFDLQTAADKMKFAILREGFDKEPLTATATATTTTAMTTLAAQAEADAARPWNLRTRRAACKAPNNGTTGGAIGGGVSVNGGGAKNLRIDERKPNFSPLRTDSKSPRLRGDLIATTTVTATATATVGEKRERAKFSVSLSRREIEEDFMAVTGHRPPRRPKKRPKILQKQLDNLFPGFWLMEVSADFYKVPDVPETGKP